MRGSGAGQTSYLSGLRCPAQEDAMLWNLGFGWAVMAFGTVVAISYMLCLMMESSLGREGYGPIGNAALIIAGFFGTIYVANLRGINLRELDSAIIWGLAGAFGTFLVMVLIKAVLARLFPS